MGQLYWCRYQKQGSNKPSYTLIYHLDTSHGKIKCLAVDHLSEEMVKIIRKGSKELNNMDYEAKIAWLKENCEESMQAFRTLDEDPEKFQILEKYNIA